MAGYEQHRTNAYLKQTGRNTLTARQRRRLAKKTNRRARKMSETLALADALQALVQTPEVSDYTWTRPVDGWATLTRDQLREAAKERSLKGYSSLKKADLAEMLEGK